MDPGDRVRAGEREEVVVAGERRRVPGQQLAPVRVLVEVEPLKHGAHRAVDDEDSRLGRFPQPRPSRPLFALRITH